MSKKQDTNMEINNVVNMEATRSISLVDLLIEGLTIDGAHHKQYYLELALLAAAHPSNFARLKEEFNWEAGIAP